jgi:hypothetical protein
MLVTNAGSGTWTSVQAEICMVHPTLVHEGAGYNTTHTPCTRQKKETEKQRNAGRGKNKDNSRYEHNTHNKDKKHGDEYATDIPVSLQYHILKRAQSLVPDASAATKCRHGRSTTNTLHAKPT